PEVVYVEKDSGPSAGAVIATAAITFGAGLAIGAWLNNDSDWYGRGIYYHGWVGPGWIGANRTFVNGNVNRNIYVKNRDNHINVNRNVVNRNINNYRTSLTRNAVVRQQNIARDRTNINRSDINRNNINRNNINPNNINRNDITRNNINRSDTNRINVNRNEALRNRAEHSERLDAYRGRQPQNTAAPQSGSPPGL